MKPPYTLKELDDYEKKYDVSIRRDVKDYLSTVSRQIGKGEYSHVFGISSDPFFVYFRKGETDTEDHCSGPFGKHDCDVEKCFEFYDSQGNCVKTDKEMEKLGFVKVRFKKLVERGCTDDYYLIIGKHYNGQLLTTPLGCSYHSIEDADSDLEESVSELLRQR